jgi:hypothetical protein
MINKTGKMMSGSRSPSAYIELLKTFSPCQIASEEEFLATQNVIDSLIDRAELTPDEQDYTKCSRYSGLRVRTTSS